MQRKPYDAEWAELNDKEIGFMSASRWGHWPTILDRSVLNKRSAHV